MVRLQQRLAPAAEGGREGLKDRKEGAGDAQGNGARQGGRTALVARQCADCWLPLPQRQLPLLQRLPAAHGAQLGAGSYSHSCPTVATQPFQPRSKGAVALTAS